MSAIHAQKPDDMQARFGGPPDAVPPSKSASSPEKSGTSKPTRRIPLRAPNFTFESLPERWYAGNLVATSAMNALHLLFPDGERFFIRSVNHYRSAVADDPALLQDIRDFAGQEGRHGYEHERAFAKLREQGVPVDSFLKVFRKVCFDIIEKNVSPKVRLSTTAGVEHFTATLGRLLLDTDVLNELSPEMGDLLHWHALEEVEHQDVAFNVLQRVDPSLPLRVVGLALGGTLVVGFWIAGGAYISLVQATSLKDFARPEKPIKIIPVGAFVKAIGEYLRSDFRPGDPLDAERIEKARAWYESRQSEELAHAAE